MFNRYLKVFYGEKTKKNIKPKKTVFFFMLGFFLGRGWVFWVGYLLPTLSKPWLTTAILNSIRTKSNYLKLIRLGIISRNMNNKYKNILSSVIRKAK